ncbi:MAG: DUF2721 domain-containing protein [Parasphingorhabdus sp.]|uniref:DUF2721 domain-containing protein n=1 Tax=Parasphingorhabdus sp. TaxID=2709688 RepID=UPI0030028DE5
MTPALTDIATVLQTAMAPAFLLVGLGAMLNLFAGRLARIIDRSRVLQDRFADTEGREHELIVTELLDLQLRMKTVNSAIYLSVMGAIVVCILIGLLFAMGFSGNALLAEVVAGAFIVAVILLSLALIQFLREVRIGIRVFIIREEFLQQTEEDIKR